MDYKIIEDEVYAFCEKYFEEISILAEDNEIFIEDNHLHFPRRNYALLGPFLQKTFKNFKILDPSFYSSTLDKLSQDLLQINEVYSSVLKNSLNVQDIFEKTFLPTSTTLVNFAKAIIDFAESADKTNEDILYLKQMKKDYTKLKEIFFSIFEEIFNDDKNAHLTSLNRGINTKTYYLDKLLWKEAGASLIIVKHFSIRKLDTKLNTKDYILFTTALMRPYTDEYQYLQNCLKVFK